MPAVCRFYQKGYCRYGSSCRFEHPGESSYSRDEIETPSTNFSFKSALSVISPQQTFNQPAPTFQQSLQYNQQQQPLTSSGFSFTRALQVSQLPTITTKADDVDMLLEETSLQFQRFIGTAPLSSTIKSPALDSAITQPAVSLNSIQEDLKQSELEAFRSDRFTFRRIPIRPPPKGLC